MCPPAPAPAPPQAPHPALRPAPLPSPPRAPPLLQHRSPSPARGRSAASCRSRVPLPAVAVAALRCAWPGLPSPVLRSASIQPCPLTTLYTLTLCLTVHFAGLAEPAFGASLPRPANLLMGLPHSTASAFQHVASILKRHHFVPPPLSTAHAFAINSSYSQSSPLDLAAYLRTVALAIGAQPCVNTHVKWVRWTCLRA